MIILNKITKLIVKIFFTITIILFLNQTTSAISSVTKIKGTYSNQYKYQNSFISSMNFESFNSEIFPPSGWVINNVNGSYNWAGLSIYDTILPHSGSGLAYYNSYSANFNNSATLITPSFSLVGGNGMVSFWMYREDSYPTRLDRISVYINNSPSLNGATFVGIMGRYSSVNGWTQLIYDIPPSFTGPVNYLIFHALSEEGGNIYIDDVIWGAATGTLGTFDLQFPVNGSYVSTLPKFQWSQSANTQFYKLYIDGNLKKDSIYSTNYQLVQNELLSPGIHTWNVKSYNQSGLQQSNQTSSFIVDNTPPSVFDLLSPINNYWSNNLKPLFTWSPSSDGGSGISKYQLWIDNILKRDSIPNNVFSCLPYSNLLSENHTWQIRAIDVSGNIRASNQTWTVNVDSMPPGGKNYFLELQNFNSNEYARVENHSSLNPTNTISIEGWFKPFTNGNGYYVLVNKRLDGNVQYQIDINNNRFECNINNTVVQSNVINFGVWYHVAAVYDGQSIKLYVNGILQNSVPKTGLISIGGYEVLIGCRQLQLNYYYGNIDELRIWNIPRTQSDIQLFLNRPIDPSTNGLVGYWRFNDLNYPKSNDETQNHNDATLFNFANLNSTINLINLGNLNNLKLPSNYKYLSSIYPNFSWTRSIDAGIGLQKYQLFVDETLKGDDITDSSYTITTPLSYGLHTWYVKGFDALGNNQCSGTRTFYVDNAPPNAFNLLTPSDSQIVNLPTPNFSWQSTLDSTGGSGLKKYQLVINGNISIDSISPNITTSSPGSALAQGAYIWNIKAYDNAGNIRYSTQTRTFYADWEPPTAFTTILPNNGDTSLTKRPTFSWHKSNDIGSGLTKYELIISGQQIITVPVTDTVKQSTFDLPNGNYTWYVKAYDRAGSFTSSNVKSLTVASIPLPLTPALFLPINSSVNQPTDAFFKWGRPGEYARTTKENFNSDNQLSILKFWFELTTDTVSFSNGLRDTSVTDTVKSVLGLSNLTTFYWRVKAKNLYNYGPFSNWNKFSTTGISSFSLNSGWNIFSVPLLSQDMSVSNIIPGASSQAFGYSNGYQQTSVLQSGKGYWIKYDSLRNFTVTGLPVTPRSINVLEGWNIIGPFETSVPVSSITSNPSGIIISNFFGFNNGYSNATTLAPGKGYWVKTSQSGSLILPSAPLASRDVTDSSKKNENWISIKITDSKQNNSILYLGNNENVTGNYTLPPIGPSGVFDARFSSDNYVDIWKGSHVIKINAAEYPVKLKVENLKGKTLRIKDNVTGKLLDQILADGAEVTINLNLESLLLTEEVLLPTTFDINQNYPNPFNPMTTIKYQIPKDEFVKITIYDLLGREIKLLVNEFKPTGYYDVKFDASNLASGVYFYQINAGNYKNIKKMVVMK